MKKLSVVLYVTAALAFLLGGPRGTSSALAGPLADQPASLSSAVATADGKAILSIPAAAFTPYQDGYYYHNEGRYLGHFLGPSSSKTDGLYYAPMNLPQGAKITKMTFYYRVKNDTGLTADAKLQMALLDTDNWWDMATIHTTGTGTGYPSDSTSTIQYKTIDNSNYTYWVVWDLPWLQTADPIEGIWGCGVTIEYIPPATLTGVLSIPAAAFNPSAGGYDYENDGRYLFTNGVPNSLIGTFVAPVQLPQGATVTKLTFHWYDANTTVFGVADLWRTKFAVGSAGKMASATSFFVTGGYGSTHDASIKFATIDNSQYSYWVNWAIPVGNDSRGCAVTIEYTIPTGANAAFISVPAASFQPYTDTYDYQNYGLYLVHRHSGAQLVDGTYYAPVNLPQGATVTNATYYFYDTYHDGYGGEVYLQRTQFGLDGYVNMAWIHIDSGSQGYASNFAYRVYYPSIDNSQYAYWLVLDLPPSQSGNDQQDWYCSVLIGYSYMQYLPAVLNNQ
jgi:hypothetical protein